MLNPRAGGSGLNIAAANHVIHYNPEWNPALEDQASARAHRRGQKRPVTVRRLIYAGTVEEVIDQRFAAQTGHRRDCDHRGRGQGRGLCGHPGRTGTLAIRCKIGKSMIEQTITKVLSANDSGETGGHQAGLLIPRQERILSFFPELDASRYNPRAHLQFEDEAGHYWEFAFIYYNNRLFGGTRNEYRLTRMTRYIREAGLVTGDEVMMQRHVGGNYSISYRRSNEQALSSNETGQKVIKLGAGWKVIEI